jgi:hypothetical protein
VQVVAGSARSATALALAAVLRGRDAPHWLAEQMAGERFAGALVASADRLVALDGEVVLVGDPRMLGSALVDGGPLEGPPSRSPDPDRTTPTANHASATTSRVA